MDYELNLPPDKIKHKDPLLLIAWQERREQYKAFQARFVVVSRDVKLKSKKADETYFRFIINGVYADMILQKSILFGKHNASVNSERDEESASPSAKRMRSDLKDRGYVLVENAYLPFGDCGVYFDRLRLVEDISKGSGYKPRNIAVFCDLFMSSSDLIFTNSFNYIEQSTRVLELDQKMEISRLTVSCRCRGACEPETCECIQLNAKCFGDLIHYKGDGNVVDKLDYLAVNKARNHNDSFLVMCGPLCGCGDGCKNHVSRLMKTDHQFEVFREKLATGFGARVLTSLNIGDILCEVVGSVTPVEYVEADNRKSRYSMELYSKKTALAVKKLYEQSGKKITRKCELKKDEDWCIEMLYEGNISRFINHGCFPNVAPIRVVANYLHPAFHRIFLMAVAPICPASEILLNYDNLMLKRDFVCKCRDEYRNEFYAGLTSDECVDVLQTLYLLHWQSIEGVTSGRRIDVENGVTEARIAVTESGREQDIKLHAENKELAARNASYFAQDEIETNIRLLRTVQNAIKLPLTSKAWQYQNVKEEWGRYETEIEILQNKIDNLSA